MQTNQHIVLENHLGNGEFGISVEVFETLAKIAVSEMHDKTSTKVKQTLFKNAKSPIICKIVDNEVVIDIEVAIKFGANVTKTCKEIQKKIQSRIFEMTSVKNIKINVHVTDVDV